MTTSLNNVLDVKLAWIFQNAIDLATTKDQQTYKVRQTVTNGTGSGQANEMFHDRRSLTQGSPTDDLDLAGGLLNVFGETITFTKIKQLVVRNLGVESSGVWTAATGEAIAIGGAAAGAWSAPFNGSATGKFTVSAGGIFVATAPIDGWDVVAGSEDVLRIALDAAAVGDVDYEIIIVGTD